MPNPDDAAHLREQSATDFRTQIFEHKWLDPQCVESGCQSLFLKHARAELATLRARLAEVEEKLKSQEPAAMLGQYLFDMVECLSEAGHDKDAPRDKQIDGFIAAWVVGQFEFRFL